MHVLRFFLMPSSPTLRGCAPARRRIRVLVLSKQSSLRLANSRALGSLHVPNNTFTALCSSTIPQVHLRPAFKSHSAPRPPQTPAASSYSPYRKRLGVTFSSARNVLPEAFPIKASD